MKNLRKSKKALSPVVASIILIAVTVAVSIAVAAWMGALTIGFMGTEELKITGMTFNDANTHLYINATNTGTSAVTINEVWVNGEKQNTVAYTPTTGSVAANSILRVDITFTSVEGNNYAVKLVSSKGNAFTYTASAPS